MVLTRTPQWILERDVGTNWFRVRRTAEPHRTAEDIKLAFEKLTRAVGSADRSHLGLLIDTREGPLRNDPEFERMVAPYQVQMMTGFARIAVLVKTPAGKLQTERLAAMMRTVKVFTDEAKAIAFASER
jgi:hypothetical protein